MLQPIPELHRVAQLAEGQQAQPTMVFRQDEGFAAGSEGVAITLFDGLGGGPPGKAEVFFTDGHIDAGGQADEVERVGRGPGFVEIVHAPDQASLFIAPRPEVFDVQIAYAQNRRGLRQMGAKLRPEL